MNVQLAEVARIAEQLAVLCEDDERLYADMLEGETDLHTIASRLHSQIASDEELLTGITARQAELAERKRRLSDRKTVTKAAIGQFMRAAKVAKLELPEATYSIRDGKPKLEVVNDDAVPEEYCTLIRKPVKATINEAFADADNLPNWLVREPARDVVTARTK